MATPDIQQEMMQYFMQLSGKEKKSVLQMIKTFLQGRKETPVPTSIEQYNREIDDAMARIDAGSFITQEDLEKEAEQW